jgi:choice-of-anchor B domain-containing protein
MELLGHWYEDSLIANSTNVRFSDCYGFVWQGREYAVAGSTEGTHVFEISDDNQFIPKGFVKGRFSNTGAYHRDYAVLGHYLYAVCDEGVSDLQIIDFQYLPDSIHVAREDSLLFGRVHNIFIDTLQQKLYSCIHRSTTSTQTIEAPLKIFSLADPLHPVELWSGPDDIPEVHDIYVRNGKAILNCGFDGLRVYDFTNTTAPAYLDSKAFYADQGYNHQGWLTPSGNTYVFADETNGMRVKKCSFNGSLVTINQYFGTNVSGGSVPHNIMATDTFAFVAYYNEGFRVFDLRHSPPVEIAHYDTYPIDNDPFKLNGNWGVYALFPSQRILASDRQFGLFLLGFDREAFAVAPPEESAIAYPNPLMPGEELLVRLPNDVTAFEWAMFDAAGKRVSAGERVNGNYLEVAPDVAAGLYQLQVTYRDYLDDEQKEVIRIVVL